MTIIEYDDGSIYNDTITCPWCRYEWPDSQGYYDDYRAVTCCECGKSFTYSRDVDGKCYMEKAGDK